MISAKKQVGIAELKEYCDLQDNVAEWRKKFKDQVQPTLDRLEELRDPVIAFIKNSEEAYQYNGKTVVIKKANRKTPLNAKYIKGAMDNFFEGKEKEVDEFWSYAEEAREVTPSESIARISKKESKAKKQKTEASDNEDNDGADEDGGDDDDDHTAV